MNTRIFETPLREPHDWTWFDEIVERLVIIIEEDALGCLYQCPCHHGRHYHKWQDDEWKRHKRHHHHGHDTTHRPRSVFSARLNISITHTGAHMAQLQFVAPAVDPNRSSFKVRVYAAGDHSAALQTIDAGNIALDADGAGVVDLTAAFAALAPGEAVDVSIAASGPAGDSSEVFADNDPFTQAFGTPLAPLSAHLA